jgi:hypothetical protein
MISPSRVLGQRTGVVEPHGSRRVRRRRVWCDLVPTWRLGRRPACTMALALPGGARRHGSSERVRAVCLGLGKILVARELVRLVASSARLDSARFNFITS